jgi:hypothetical protein
MQAFYKKLCGSSRSKVPYLQALSAVTKATQTQIQTVASGFSWQSWIEAEKYVQA